MNLIETQSLNEKQMLEIIDLWNGEYPQALSLTGLTDFEQYLQTLSDKYHILLSDKDGAVKGWLIYFVRENEQCFAMLLDSSIQGQGWGSKLLDLAKKRNSELHGWVIDSDRASKQNGQHYLSPIKFYLKNGFEIRADIQSNKKGINGIRVTWKSNK